MSPPPCPRCGAPRASGPECPRCGVVYAKAERRAGEDLPEADVVTEPARPARGPSAAALFAREHAKADARSELWLARLAVPVAFLLAWVLVHSGLGKFFFRTFAGMWLHELGHAVTAWFCGYPAFPGPWFTPVWEDRSPLFVLAIMGGLGYAGWKGWTTRDRVLTAAAVAAFALQLVGTLGLSEHTAQTLITFGGGAGSLIFGAAFMATFYAPPGHKLHRDWLRWGLLVLGAAAFVDTFEEWWSARTDIDAIVFGEIEGHGATDQSRLVDEYGWSIPSLVRRYFSLGVACLLALIPLQLLAVRRARAALLRDTSDLK